jgi:putative membrane protein
MYALLLAALALGIFIGIFTGLFPGIHVNMVVAALLGLAPLLVRYFEPLSLAVFIVSLSVTHSFLDTIPSIFLGAPENENALSVLPGQRMLLSGEGHMAVKITILGTYVGMLAAVILIPIFVLTASRIFPFLKPVLPYVLVAIVSVMIFREKDFIFALIVFFLSGTLGIIVFSSGAAKDPLFPLLSGLFGVSGLIISYFENTKVPPQRMDGRIDISGKDTLRSVSGASVGVIFTQFFPGMGPAQGAVLSSQLIKDMKDRTYLALVGAIGTMSVIFSLATLYALNKAKDGSVVAISKILILDRLSLCILVAAMVVAGSVSVFLVMFFSRVFTRMISRVNYKALVVSVIVFVFAMCLALNGPLGILIMVTSTAIGLIAPLRGVARSHAMGCLLLPVLFYLI